MCESMSWIYVYLTSLTSYAVQPRVIIIQVANLSQRVSTFFVHLETEIFNNSYYQKRLKLSQKAYIFKSYPRCPMIIGLVVDKVILSL